MESALGSRFSSFLQETEWCGVFICLVFLFFFYFGPLRTVCLTLRCPVHHDEKVSASEQNSYWNCRGSVYAWCRQVSLLSLGLWYSDMLLVSIRGPEYQYSWGYELPLRCHWFLLRDWSSTARLVQLDCQPSRKLIKTLTHMFLTAPSAVCT